ncbi:MAG: response regulator transcription factor [Clostridia bacterium]|nr:response regulator transcription factor [Clostridia bacterium]
MSEKIILIVEDEKPISDILKFNLEKEGFKTMQAFDGEQGLNLALNNEFDLILLDVMLPKMDGFNVLKEIRVHKQTPIIMVTAREDEIDKVLGLELGADDYITKPYSVRELLARIKANLRRSSSENSAEKAVENSNILKIGRLIINSERYEVTKDDQLIDLTRREFELLRFLAEQPEKIFSREALLKQVWDFEYVGDVRTVDVTVRRLREKIEDNSSEPTYIVTKRGLGYYFSNSK